MLRTIYVLGVLALCALYPASPSRAAKSDHAHEPHEEGVAHSNAAVEPAIANATAFGSGGDRVAIQVNGIVCSFCAHGLEKALSKLEGLDPDVYGNGVLVDIESQRVTLAMRPGSPIDFAEAHKRIVKAGYDPVYFNFQVRGQIESAGDGWRIVDSMSGVAYRLRGDASAHDQFEEGASVALELQVDAEQTSRLKDDDVVAATVLADS